MDYQQAIEYLHSLHRFGTHLGLSRMERLLDSLDNPQRDCQAIHVAGTNGKGSVTAMVASILQQAGYRAGRYISPYLERFSERIRLNDREISPDDIAHWVTILADHIQLMYAEDDEHPTEFEAVTTLAFAYFRERMADLVALEVGLGGRYDATNVVNGLVSVITNIGWDHMQQLGDTLEKIAWEKAGVIKPESMLVTGAEGVALRTIEAVAQSLDVPVIKIGRDIIWREIESGIDGQVITVDSPFGHYENLYLPLLGRHQQANGALAIAAVEALAERGYPVSEIAIRQGLRQTEWPGRLEILQREPLVLLDGAHNVDGVRSLAAALRHIIPHQQLLLILGVLEDKQVEQLLAELVPLASEVIATRPISPRALDPERLAKAIRSFNVPVTVEEDIERAVKMGLERVGPNDCLCVAGSLYLIGHARSLIREGI